MGPRISTSVKPDRGNEPGAGGNQIVVLTIEQLKGLASEVAREVMASLGPALQPQPQRCRRPEPEDEDVEYFPPKGKEYVFGIRGIRNLFNVSHTTAQRYKNTFLQPAVLQRGRIIAVDVEMARELFNDYQNDFNQE